MKNAGYACDYFLKLRPSWRVSAWDSNGLSGGTLVAWNPQMADLKAFITTAGIMVEGHFLGYLKVIRILNNYAPYNISQEFWENIFQSALLDDRSLIVAGDLNLTLSMDEVWGAEKSKDPLSYFSRSNLRK